MIYNLFLDDVRSPEQAIINGTQEKLLEISQTIFSDWIVVRNYENFCSTIKKLGLPKIISFDHDLGDEAMRELIEMLANESSEFNYKKVKEKTGMDCARFLIDYCLDNSLKLPLFYVHSFNPVGAENIQKLLQNFNENYI